MNFNSRPSARGDRVARLSCRAFRHFNSRPSARGDTRHPNSAVHPPYFNSRPSARGDRFGGVTCHAGWISIHAPPRGATDTGGGTVKNLNISIHAPPRGATKRTYLLPIPVQNFNSRPSARGDMPQASRRRRKPHFNSRPSARGDAQAR